MASSQDLINFDLLELHKENVQPIQSGRSAKALASILSPRSSGKEPTLEETKTFYDVMRSKYEEELQLIEDADDPLEVYYKVCLVFRMRSF